MELQRIKEIERALLQHFDRFCRQNSIVFYLSNGTLLGAVKYGGFIPWDDDVDVLVPREDYDRLIKNYRNTNRYVLLSPERNDKFLYPFAKLCDMSTVLEELNYDNGVSMGVNIDIFPLDAWAPTYYEACEQVRRNKSLTKALGFSKIKTYIPGAGRNKMEVLVRKCSQPLYRMIGAKYFRDQMIRTALRHRNITNPQYLGCVVWPVYGEGEILPAEVFCRTVDMNFEGEKYPAPVGYDRYLRDLYGDYEKDPPLEKQVTHHNFVVSMRETYNS